MAMKLVKNVRKVRDSAEKKYVNGAEEQQPTTPTTNSADKVTMYLIEKELGEMPDSFIQKLVL